MNKCFITDLPIETINQHLYRIHVNNDDILIQHGLRDEELLKSRLFKENKHLFAGIIINKKSSKKPNDYFYDFTFEGLEELIPKIDYPKTPKDKMDNLLKELYKLQKYDGEELNVHQLPYEPQFFYKLFFKSAEECLYYFKVLKNLGLINSEFQDHTELPVETYISFKGLNYLIELSENGNLSNKCFVAMAFNSETEKIRSTIKKVLEKNKFVPVIIDEKHIESTQTINDAIIAGIKSSKFCIADFSFQRNGVYFESGFAAGLGKQVIYTCKEDHFKDSHFDTKHFSHIIYNDMNDFEKMLDDKIKAWIL